MDLGLNGVLHLLSVNNCTASTDLSCGGRLRNILWRLDLINYTFGLKLRNRFSFKAFIVKLVLGLSLDLVEVSRSLC